jgi:hypothetical protein
MGLLWMRDLALKGEVGRTPATKRMPKSFVRMRSAWRHGQQRTDLSVREFLLALGRLGGHLNRRRDGLPGWQTPWQGWEKLTRMVQGPQRLRTTCREAANTLANQARRWMLASLWDEINDHVLPRQHLARNGVRVNGRPPALGGRPAAGKEA